MNEQLNKTKRTFRFSIYLSNIAAVCLCAVLLMAQSRGITTKDPASKEAMDVAIKALGGTDKIDGIKSLVIKGVKSFNSLAGEFEIRMLLPDNFIIIDRSSISTNYSGVTRETAIPPMRIMTVSGGKIVEAPTTEEFAKLDEILINHNTNNRKDEWSYFLTGMLMKSGPMLFTLSSGVTSGKFSLTKNDSPAGEIEFDSKTGYPSIVRYKEIILAPNGNKQEMDRTIRFRDHFSVNGIMFPRIISSTNPRVGDLRIDEVQINPALNLKDFEIPK